MSSATPHERDEWGVWRPPGQMRPAPPNYWPPAPRSLARWFFGWPGYLWPFNALWFALALFTWALLTPDLASMRSFEVWWIGLIFVRNAVLTLLLFGGLHYYLYLKRGQGDWLRLTTRPFATGNRRFRFRSQVRENVCYTLASGVPVFTAFEVCTWWGFANGYLGYGLEGTGGFGVWAWTAILAVLAPMIHGAHFYFGHRLLHTKLLYRRFHALHHKNTHIGPWAGLSMHPVEHVIYFSTVVVQWLLAVHPVNALFQIQIAVIYAALAHTGFEKVMLGTRLGMEGNSYFHYLHHKHFECNYGGTTVALDHVFGTHHDGTVAADGNLRQRLEARKRILPNVSVV